MAARFSIGIDLGTTNSALACVPLTGDARPEALVVSQWESPAALAESPTLPSFLYLPEDGRAAELPGRVRETEGWIAGLFARRRAGETPGRVVRSAKSWPCHHSADRSAPILPWGSEDLAPAQKISPVRAAALILSHLRGAWDSRFAGFGFAFDEQEITITVPASFDAAAQRLTLDAAEDAGFPGSVRQLEEPQAAFYCWLEQHGAAEPLWEGLDPHTAEPRRVLIVDIGGGTSDFSLFELRRDASGAIPDIRRVAVSEHIQIIVAARLEQGECPFEVITRFDVFSGEPACEPSGAMGDAGFGRIGSRLEVAEEGRRVRLHRWQVAPYDASDPQTPVGRQSFGRILVTRRRVAGSGKGLRRFRRAIAARCEERVAVGDLQLCQSLVRSGRAACRQPPCRSRLVRHRDRFAEMGDRLLEGGPAQRLVARPAPPFDGDIVETGLGEMMGDRFGLGVRVAQRLGRPAVQRLPATLEKAVVGRILEDACLQDREVAEKERRRHQAKGAGDRDRQRA